MDNLNKLETRSVSLEHVEVDDEKRTITGRAIVYNSLSVELRTVTGDKFREVILPGAASESIKSNDILALRDHDTAQILARTSAGTLILEDREDGLYYTISVPETSYGKDLLVSAKRGDIKGMSFGFRAGKQRTFSKGGEKIRELATIELREISVVASPAYLETTLAIRSEDFVEEATPAPKAEDKLEDKKEEVRDNKNLDKDYAYKFKLISLTHK